MRFLLALLGLAALVIVALVSLGMLKIDTKAGSLPSLSLSGGKAPEVTANLATVEIDSENRSIEVPKLTTTTKTISVPTLHVNKPGGAEGNSAAAQ